MLVAAIFLPLASFFGGFAWRKLATGRESQAVPLEVGAEQKAKALHALDEAVHARFEGRWQAAINGIRAARSADPQVRGVDILIAEIAVEQKDPETLRQGTERALRTAENEASAKLLRAVEMWMKRGEKGDDQAGLLAGQYLAEAAEGEPSNAAVHFFHGELSRLLGQGEEAHRHLRGALYRQAPWLSSALLEVKTQIAAREASDAGTSVVVGAPTAQADVALALLESIQSGGSTASAQADFHVITPALQSLHSFEDPAFAVGGAEPAALQLREQMKISTPHLHAVDGVTR